jgi:filamentous hemagglutinin family protein
MHPVKNQRRLIALPRLAKAVGFGTLLLTVALQQTSAAPQNPVVEHGRATFTTRGSTTTIHASNNSIINFSTLNLSSGEKVVFVLPTASARVLDRVIGGAPTTIDGTITSNGSVTLANPLGITFGPHAIISAHSFAAIGGAFSSPDFLNNTGHFTPTGPIDVEGGIKAQAIMLVGQQVSNHGSLVTGEGGIVVMAASGGDVYLSQPQGRVMVQLPAPASTLPAGGVDNLGTITAPKGQVLLGAGDMYSLTTHSTSTVTAKTITLTGGASSQVNVSGTLDASATGPGAMGGTVQVLGDTIQVTSATIDASGTHGGGTVLVGGDTHGGNGVPTAFSTNFDLNSVVHADAARTGNGGRVVVWADDNCAFSGTITARGGSVRGNGGSVETSGERVLGVDDQAVVDVRAPHGKTGMWTMDPGTPIVIDAEDPSSGANNTLDDNSGSTGHTVANPLGGTALTFFEPSDPVSASDPTGATDSPVVSSCNASFIHVETIQGSMSTANMSIQGPQIFQFGQVTLPAGQTQTLTYSGAGGANASNVMFIAPQTIFNGANTAVGTTTGGGISGPANVMIMADNVAVNAPMNVTGAFMSGTVAQPGMGTFSSTMPITAGGAVSLMHAGSVILAAPVNAGTTFSSGSAAQPDAGAFTATMPITAGGAVSIMHAGPVMLGASLTTSSSFTSGSAAVPNGSTFTSTMPITAGGPVQIMHAGQVTVGNTLTSTAGGVMVQSTSSGVQAMGAVTGAAATFQAAQTVALHSVTTSGAQSYTAAAVTADSDLVGQGITVGAPITLTGTAPQSINAGSGSLMAMGAVSKTAPGDLALFGQTGVMVMNPVAVMGGNFTAQTEGGNIVTNGATSSGMQVFSAGLAPNGRSLGTVSLAGSYSGGGVQLNPGIFSGTSIPSAATLFMTSANGSTLAINTHGQAFVMGQNQKLAVQGNLTITTLGGDAILSDITTTGSFILDTRSGNPLVPDGSVTFQNRPGAEVTLLNAAGKPYTVEDKGLGFLTGESLQFLVGSGKLINDPILSAGDVGESITPSSAFPITMFHGGNIEIAMVPGAVTVGGSQVMFDGVEMTPPAIVTAPVAANVASIADINPQQLSSQANSTEAAVETTSGLPGTAGTTTVTSGAAGLTSNLTPPPAAVVQSPPLGLYIVPPSEQAQAQMAKTGIGFYDDASGVMSPQKYFSVTSARVPAGVESKARADYGALFGSPADPDRVAAIRNTLQESFDRYSKSSHIGQTYHTYLLHTPSESQARQYASQITDLADQIEAMGLSAAETRSALTNTFRPITPAGVVPWMLPKLF